MSKTSLQTMTGQELYARWRKWVLHFGPDREPGRWDDGEVDLYAHERDAWNSLALELRDLTIR